MSETAPSTRFVTLAFPTREAIPIQLREDAMWVDNQWIVTVLSQREYDRACTKHAELRDKQGEKIGRYSDTVFKMWNAMKDPSTYCVFKHEVPDLEAWCKVNAVEGCDVLMNDERHGVVVLFKNTRDATLFKLFFGEAP